MRNFTVFTVMVAIFFSSLTSYAQEVLVVDPGIGTLNTAIDTYGGDRIYQLQAGKFYQITAKIENAGYHLQIIGEEPVDGGKPATLQNNADNGIPFDNMFDAKGDFTMKNVYLVNADFDGNVGYRVMDVNYQGARIEIDNCVLDPVCATFAFQIHQSNVKMFFTNNLAINQGHETSPNDGHFFATEQAPAGGDGMDTLYVENNTFVATGTGMYSAGFTGRHDGYIKWNHNTWVMQKSQIDWNAMEDTWIFTNNLMFDFQTQPWAANWQPLPDGDASAPKPGLIHADTLTDEVLPSVRQQFVQYNLHYRNSGFYTLLDELNVIQNSDGSPELVYMDLLYGEENNETNPDVNLRSRETILFANDTDFPNWKFGNEFKDIDPQFEDAEIYTHSDNFVLWTNPATQIHAMGKSPDDFPNSTEWPSWHWDPDGDKGNNATWPVFNGVYTNSELLTASIEGLPLGDLNWFMDKKVIWEENKEMIDAHIHAGNTEKISELGIEDGFGIGDFPSKCYPNPVVNGIANIEFSIPSVSHVSVKVFNISGQLVETLLDEKKSKGEVNVELNTNQLGNGVYFYSIKADRYSSNGKIIINQ